MNDEVRLHKWKEKQEAKQLARERGEAAEEMEDEKTATGLEGWYLGVPNWSAGRGQASPPPHTPSRRFARARAQGGGREEGGTSAETEPHAPQAR